MTKINNEVDDSRESRGFSKLDMGEHGGATSDDDERAEKPWHRVAKQFSKKGEHFNEPVGSVPSVVLILVLGVYLLLGFLTQLVEDDMPSVVKISSLDRDTSDRFSEESALRYLGKILGDKPRVSGTKYHFVKTRDMKSLVDDIAASATIKVETDWQMVTGDYFLKSSAPFFNFYHNCSNIIALLEGDSGYHSDGSLGSSILVNCHYDSVPFAMGASDNGIFCAAMAETLSRLSKRRTKLKHNVIFLFNGAEENPLQASHAFLSHPWSRGAVALINLDSAGMNGKPMVFQVTDPRVISAYSRTASRPAAQGLAEFLFTAGVIRSDTDFRVFRDFGNIHGIDIAFTKMGHVYHTRNDAVELIRPGVVQNAGDMLLGLVTRVADLENIGEKMRPTAAVYFDYLNAFMVTYSYTAAYVVDVLVVLAGLASVYYYLWLVGARVSSLKELSLAAVSRLLSMVAGAAVGALFVVIMVATTTQMRYLSRAWLVVPLYWIPYLIAAIVTSHAFDMWRWKKSGLSRSLRMLQAMASTRLLLSVILLILVCIPSLTPLRYLVGVPLLIMTTTSIMSITVVRYIRLTGWQHLILEVLLSLPVVMWTLSLALRLDAMMLPLMGRSDLSYPDYTVGLLNIGLVILVATGVSGLELLFSRKHMWLVMTAVGIPCIVLMFIPFSPYDENGVALQRHYWFHSQITSYDINGTQTSQTSGILVMKMDPYGVRDVISALSSSGMDLEVRTDFGADCDTMVYCGMPTYRSAFGRQNRNAMFIYTDPPAPAQYDPPISFTVESKICSGNTCTYYFRMTGSAHNIVTLWPLANITIESWSLQSPVAVCFTQLERPVYVIYHATATYMERWDLQFMVVFNVPQSLQSGPIVEISHHSNKLQHPEDFTVEYTNILNSMPKYFNIATILSVRNNYVF
ncbi:unnamed protein product [Arctia plantaginis]|uniref:FXNA-like protease n=1 Tax=Arctia plantaginis TaxID=874455 RepID=A0A8S0YZS9_ARCPL|nr:unnamed protein product [Arctia plantaginis]